MVAKAIDSGFVPVSFFQIRPLQLLEVIIFCLLRSLVADTVKGPGLMWYYELEMKILFLFL